MENPADLRVIRGMSWNRTGIFLIFSSQGRKTETDYACGQRERCAGKLGFGSWILERAIIHRFGCTFRGLFQRVNRWMNEESILIEPLTYCLVPDSAYNYQCTMEKTILSSTGWGASVCLKVGFWGEVQACSNLVHQESSWGCLFEAEWDPPHLISACNRTAITSDDNTEVTNDCDLIKRDRRWLPAD